MVTRLPFHSPRNLRYRKWRHKIADKRRYYTRFLQINQVVDDIYCTTVTLFATNPFEINRSMENVMFGKDYCDKFNPQEYLQMYCSVTNLGPFHLFGLKCVHEFYRSYPSTVRLKMLDIGSGPTIAFAISAAPHAAEIVLSEYTEANRTALLQWLNNDPKAFDWTHVFKHVVVDLEGKSEKEVPVRAELVRKVIKAVVPCDVTRNPPIPSQYVDEYDIVTDYLCLVSACATREDYIAALVRLHALLKPGGKIVLFTPECPSTSATYVVGSHRFFNLQLSKDFIFKSLEQAGFCDIKVKTATRDELGLQDDIEPDTTILDFITASKMTQLAEECNL